MCKTLQVLQYVYNSVVGKLITVLWYHHWQNASVLKLGVKLHGSVQFVLLSVGNEVTLCWLLPLKMVFHYSQNSLMEVEYKQFCEIG